MTLEELKKKVYSLIEEYDDSSEELTSDEDLANKFNSVANQVQNELARLKKIPEYTTKDVKKGDNLLFTDLASDIYQLNIIRGINYDIIANRVLVEEDGTAEIFYYRYPKQINDDTEDDFKLDLTTDVLEIMPYGIAADLLKSDVSQQYGAVYRQRYEELKQMLDPRYGTGMVEITGGINI